MLVSQGEAVNILKSIVSEIGVEKISLKDSYRRILAKDVAADIDVPPFDKSAMDGFAVRAHETFNASYENPIRLKLIDKILAGDSKECEIKSGCCVEVATGAKMPLNADAVVMLEYTEVENDFVRIFKPVSPGENVIKRGSDIAKGSILAKRGSVIDEKIVAKLAACGVACVTVRRKPRIAIISTGNEILEPGVPYEDGKIYDINSYTISFLCEKFFCEPYMLGIFKDDRNSLSDAIGKALNGEYDLILITGGSSVGTGDILEKVIRERGEILAHGIARKPGKPVIIAKMKDKPLIGLPGYPVSAISCFYTLILPAIEKMLSTKIKIEGVEAKSAQNIYSGIGLLHYIPVKLKDGKAMPLMKGSGIISSFSEADGFMVIQENKEFVRKGEKVYILLV